MGYDDLFAIGMLAAGHLGTLAASVPGTSVRSLSFRFLARSWVGPDVTCTVHAESATDERAVLALLAVDSDGAQLVRGQAEVALTG